MKDKVGTRGREFTGIVTSDKMAKTVTVEWDRRKHVPKYERYTKKRSRVKAHNPENINAKVGDMVRIAETRPLSKTKKFIVTKVLSKEEVVTQEKMPAEIIQQESEKKQKEKTEAKDAKSEKTETVQPKAAVEEKLDSKKEVKQAEPEKKEQKSDDKKGDSE